MKITIVGLGYVGLSLAILLARSHRVVGVDINEGKINQLKRRNSPINDVDIIESLRNTETLNIEFSTIIESSINDSELVIIATPTNYDEKRNYFDTSSVDSVVKRITELSPNTLILIKSTVPVGYTQSIKERFQNRNIIFSPEFLREGTALRDNRYPSRIIVGENSSRARKLAETFRACSNAIDTPILLTNSNEAEAIKLFSNTYLAMRVSFFNELDSYAELCDLNARSIIDGVCLDPRIGQFYNNPSFGYGGYCLPKDTRQLLANYSSVPQNLIRATVEANETRKLMIASSILNTGAKIVGVYRLVMKAESDNYRESAILGVIEHLLRNNVVVMIYEPLLKTATFRGCDVVKSLSYLKKTSDIIVSNRQSPELEDVTAKVYSRDLYTSC